MNEEVLLKSPFNVGSRSIASLEEDELLESLHNSDSHDASGDVEDGAWPDWTDEQKEVMSNHLNYKLDEIERIKKEIEQINKAWRNGRIMEVKKKSLKRPEGDLHSIIFRTSAPKRKKDQSFKSYSNDEFNAYLKKLLIVEIVPDIQDEAMPTNDIHQMALHLSKCHSLIQDNDKKSLNAKLKLGKKLNRSKKIYAKLKKKNENWSVWIDKSVNISISYANRCIMLHKLVKEYPKLSQLNISFTELFQMKKKISDVFKENSTIASEWK